jgi:hypothetical protein
MDNNIGKNVIDKHNVRGSQDSTVNEYAKNKNSSNGNYNKYQHLSGSSQHPYIKHSINSTSSLLKKLEK